MKELRPHQKYALTQLDNGRILWGGTGSGKSAVAVAFYIQEHCPSYDYAKDVYVFTTAKKRDSGDWSKEFADVGIGWHGDATRGGILTVDSWNNISKYEEVSDAFFIFDEQRLVGSGAWVKSFLKIAKHNHWIMLSATPGDTWIDYIPVFIANGWYKNRTEFIREHVVYAPFVKFPRILRYLSEGKLQRLRSKILVHMPYEKATVRHEKTIWVEHDETQLQEVAKKRWHIFADRPIRDISELWLVWRRIVNSDTSRVKAIRALLKKHPKLIVFYNFDYELELLRTLKHVTEVAELNGHKHEDIPTGDSWVYLVQYVAGSEAWNCVDTNATVFYSLTYSYKLWEQAHGRIDRMNTPFRDLYYYVFRSRSFVCRAIWTSLKNKKDFNVKEHEHVYEL